MTGTSHSIRKPPHSKMGLDCIVHCTGYGTDSYDEPSSPHCNTVMHSADCSGATLLKWDYKAIFQKPKPKDVALAVALFLGYIVYALAMSTLLEHFGIMGGELIEENSITVMTLITSVFSLMSEEFIKFIPFVFFLRLCFKFSNNRKLSIIVSVALVMVIFASLHAYTFNMFLFALCIQGFGSIFEFIGYIKTKNILISYITHFCTDALIFSLAILGL